MLTVHRRPDWRAARRICGVWGGGEVGRRKGEGGLVRVCLGLLPCRSLPTISLRLRLSPSSTGLLPCSSPHLVLRLMASPAAAAAAEAEFTRETARRSLIAISQSLPETSLLNPKVNPPSTTPGANGYRDDGAAKCRSNLISISYPSTLDAICTPCPPKNTATV